MMLSSQPTSSKRKCNDNDLPSSKKSKSDTLNDKPNEYQSSGLKKSLHGNIYQLKLLMLFVINGVKNKYKFKIATEMDAAEKFDDLVLQYKLEGENRMKYIFLQAKHKQNDEKQKITANNLLLEKDCDFSLEKYFISFRRIKRNPKFQGLKHFYLCTNIDLDLESLNKAQIATKIVKDIDGFFTSIQKPEKIPSFYKLDFTEKKIFYKTLRETSDIYMLAKTLAQHIKNKTELHKKNYFLKSYHTFLVNYGVIVIEKKSVKKYIGKFNTNFENFKFEYPYNDPEAIKSAKKLHKIIKECLVKNGLSLDTELKSSGSFGQGSENTYLLNDEIGDEEINEFLDQLILAVKQPNEIELGEIIKTEMGEDSKFNLLDPNLVAASFGIKMLDWFKTKEGTWISNEDVQQFFKSVEAKANTLVSAGLSKIYIEELKGYNIEFINENESLKKFLTADCFSQIFNLIDSTETVLSAIKVYGILTLKELSKTYKQIDSYIFMRLRTLIQPQIQQMVLKAFRSSRSHNLLVIDCDSETTEWNNQELHTELTKIINKTENHKKKIILITKESSALANKFETNTKYKDKYKKQEPDDDDKHFTDLTQTTQVNLLDKPIVFFQGENICLNKLIDLSDENTNQIINSKTLVKLIQNTMIKIGNKHKELEEISDYYISRSINTQVSFDKIKLKKDIQKHLNSNLFVISGTDSELIGITNKIFIFENNNDKRAGERFQELIKQHKDTNIHWLMCESKKLVWLKSWGSISSLVKYREVDKFDNDISREGLTEEQYLRRLNSKIVIISNKAGMGKSTVLTSLALQIKKENPSLWVIRIDLNDYTTVLEEEKKKRELKTPSFTNHDVNSVVDFLINKLLKSQKHSKLKTKLERDLFKNCINVQNKMALLFDGFDEICPNYQELIIDILQTLKETQVKKIFVTTRPNMRMALEEKLEVFSDLLQPFSKRNQKKFLTRFWIKRLNQEDLNQERKTRLKAYANSLIKIFSTSINDRSHEFIGIPLHTMMLAEIFQENTKEIQKELGEWECCKKFLSNDNINPKLPENLNLLGLYQLFVKKKFYEFYLEAKEHRDLTKPGAKMYAKENFENFVERHYTMALSELLSENDLKKIFSVREIKKLNDWIKDIENLERNEGIIDKIIDNKPHFIHRTFAEYFASIPLIEKMPLNSNVMCSVVNSLVANTSPVFISSIAEILNKENLRIDEHSVLDFITRNKESYLIFLHALLEIDYQDDLGKTSLHYAVQCNCKVTIENLLNYKHDILGYAILKHGNFKNKEYQNSNIVKFVNIKDNEGKTALDYADNFELDMQLSFTLLLRGATIDGLTQKYRKKLTLYMLRTEYGTKDGEGNFNSNILGYYLGEDNNFRPIQEKLLMKCPEIYPDLPYHDQCRLLPFFFVHGRIKVIKTLLSTVKDKNKRKMIINYEKSYHTPLDRVNCSKEISDDERLKITRYLLKNGGIEVKQKIGWSDENYNRYMTTILQAAAQNGHIKTFKHFIYKENREYYHLNFYTAANSQQFNIIEYLMKNHRAYMEHDGFTPLHDAVDSFASLKIIKYCIDNGEKINAKNDIGETPLFQAIYKYRLNVIKYLVNQGADVNIVSQRKFTVLNHAIVNDDRDTIKYILLECKGNVKFTSELIRNKIKFFKNPNLNLNKENGMSCLHRAIKLKQLEWCKFIIQEGADINITDREGKTPLHWASKLELTEIVEWLLQYGAIFDAKDINNLTPCDLLSESGSNKITWLLNLLKTLFSSQHLMKELDDKLLKSLPGYLKNWGPYGKGIPDAWDRDNPMLFILNAKNSEGKILLHKAADTNDQEAINMLLKFNNDYLARKQLEQQSNLYPQYKYYKSISIDARDSNENTPLHLAAQKGHEQMVSLLLDKGAIFNGKNRHGKTPEELAKNNDHDNITILILPTKNLFEAIKQNSFDEVINCINGNAYINAKDENGRTPLHLAASSDVSDILQFLLKKGANIKALDKHDQTPLHLATKNNKIENVKLLLKNGVTFNAKDTWNKAPFEFENNQSVNLLNAINNLFNYVGSDNPEVIHSEVIIEYFQLIQRDYNVDINTIVNICDNQWNTILHYATEQNKLDIVKLLLENGAIFDAQNKFKGRAYYLTHHNIISLVLEQIQKMFENIDYIQENETVNMKIITNVRNDKGRTLLHMAAESGKLYIVKRLVQAGANVNSVDKDSKTPLHLVVEYGSLDSVKFMIEHGADVSLEDKNGKTALRLAEESDSSEIVQFLVNLNNP